MARYVVLGIAALCGPACAAEPSHQVEEQPFMQMQGTGLQGILLQGTLLQGMALNGFQFSGATLNGAPLNNLRIEKGELVAEQNGVTLRGPGLIEMHLFAEAQKPNVNPPQKAVVEYRVHAPPGGEAAIVAESPMYDPKNTGNTFLYRLEQNIDNMPGAWQPACLPDSDGRTVAIPLADTWNDRGSRNSSSMMFTLGCTTGAIAKCYRWGYRPWVTGFGNLTITHWACTRVARADYCGDGQSHTMENTMINVWDSLASPIQAQGMTPMGMVFEAAWNQGGAICLSHQRWAFNGPAVTAACQNRLRPNTAVCDNVAEALMNGGGPSQMFDESHIGP